MNKDVVSQKKTNETYPGLLKHNVFIVWKPEYNLGIPIIDEQHRGIVTIINTLHFEMQNNYVKNMLPAIVDMMYDYTVIHFQIEESFLEMNSFPHAKEHHELHRELSSKLANTGRKSLLDKDPQQFMSFLKGWWINHICCEDLIFRDFLI